MLLGAKRNLPPSSGREFACSSAPKLSSPQTSPRRQTTLTLPVPAVYLLLMDPPRQPVMQQPIQKVVGRPRTPLQKLAHLEDLTQFLKQNVHGALTRTEADFFPVRKSVGRALPIRPANRRPSRSQNPNGISPQSPGVARHELPWEPQKNPPTPTGLPLRLKSHRIHSGTVRNWNSAVVFWRTGV